MVQKSVLICRPFRALARGRRGRERGAGRRSPRHRGAMVVVNNLLVSGRQVPRRSINSRINERPALSSSERAQRSLALSLAVRRSFRYFYNLHGGPRDQQTGGSARNNARPPTCRTGVEGRERERERGDETNTNENTRAHRQTRVKRGRRGSNAKKKARGK